MLMKLTIAISALTFPVLAQGQAPPKTHLKVGDAAPALFGLDKFSAAGAQVFGVSTDNTPSQRKFAETLGVTFPMLSDFSKRQVSKEYGVLMPDRGIANRATFVIDKEGRIQHIEEGSAAIDISGAASACSRLAGKH